MGCGSSRRWKEFEVRRAKRVAQRGVCLEDEIERLLRSMQERGLIACFTRHEHNSLSDRCGKDFTVRKLVGDHRMERSFGVTISSKSQNRARVLHYDIPQWWLPVGTKPETVERKILELFDENA